MGTECASSEASEERELGNFSRGLAVVLIAHLSIIYKSGVAGEYTNTLLVVCLPLILASKSSQRESGVSKDIVEFATQQFESTAKPTLYIVALFVLLVTALALHDPSSYKFALMNTAVCILIVSMRAYLESMRSQQRALLYFGRGLAVAEFCRQFYFVDAARELGGAGDLSVFLFTRLLVFNYNTCLGYCSMHLSHRLALASFFLSCLWRGPLTYTIGKALENALTLTACFLGVTGGCFLENLLWRGFRREQAERQLRHEAQEQAQAALNSQAESERQAAQAARDAKLEQDFFAMTTHEVRNPLNGLVGSLRLALPLLDRLGGDGAVMAELRRVLDDATACSDVCLQVLVNMMSMQRLEAGLLQPDQQPTRLAQIFSRATAVVKPQLQVGVVLRQHLEDSAALVVDADPKMLVQSARSQPAPPLGSSERTHARARRSPSALSQTLACPDSACASHHQHHAERRQAHNEWLHRAARLWSAWCGRRPARRAARRARQRPRPLGREPRELLRQVTPHPRTRATSPPTHTPREMRFFLGAGWPFAAAPTARRYSSSGGTGLGLYLTRLQVEHLGGSISVHSPWTDAHSGAEFRVKLPLRLAACASEQPTETAPPPRFGPGVRVLVADDIKLNRALLKRAFTKQFGADWTVQEAATAEDALGALQHGGPFDLLVMDEIFSDMNRSLARGSEAVQQLRQREAADGRPRLTVISCTGNAELGEMHARLLECGADEVWTKPFPNPHDGSMQRSLAKLLPQHVL